MQISERKINAKLSHQGLFYVSVVGLVLSGSTLLNLKAQASASTDDGAGTQAQATAIGSGGSTASTVTLKGTATALTPDAESTTGETTGQTPTDQAKATTVTTPTTASPETAEADKATSPAVDQSGTGAGVEAKTVPTTSTPNSPTTTGASSTEASVAGTTTTGTTPKTTSTVAKAADATEKQSTTSGNTTRSAVAATSKLKADTTTEPAADTVVNFADAVLEARVVQALGLAPGTSVTIGDIQNAKLSSTNTLEIMPFKDGSMDPYPITSLAGMEAFQYLPGYLKFGTGIAVTSAGYDLTPLQGLKFKELYLETPNFSQVDLTQLTAIDPQPLQIISLTGTSGTYHRAGMTNEQLAGISGWLTEIMNTGSDKNYRWGFLQIVLSWNSISDFSSLSGINVNVDDVNQGGTWITAFYQAHDVATPVLNVVNGQPLIFTPVNVIGVKGETLKSDVLYSLDGQTLTQLDNGQFEALTPVETGNYFAYGQQYGNYLNQYYGTSAPNSGLRLQTNVLFVQAANWQAYPTITVQYVDQATGREIQSADVYGDEDTLIGDQLVLTVPTIAGYQLVADSVPADVTYSADPQTIRLAYRQVAGAVTVNYVTTDGTLLGTGEATYPQGQWVGQTYTTSARDFADYTLKEVDPTGLAANGTLSAAGGTVTYVYAPVVYQGTITVVYYDVTSDTILMTERATGTAGTVSPYQTTAMIKYYQSLGYQLDHDPYPADGATYDRDPQTFTVNLSHELVTISDASEVTRTIKYVFADGQPAAPDQQTTVTFTRYGQHDLVTDLVVWTDWQPADAELTAVTSPTLSGYVADQAIVPAVQVTVTSADSTVTVTYTKQSVDPELPVAPEQPGEPDEINVPAVPDTPHLPIQPGAGTENDLTRAAADQIAVATTRSQPILPSSGALSAGTGAARPVAAAQRSQAKQLPQTNETSGGLWALIGAGWLTCLGWFGLRRKN